MLDDLSATPDNLLDAFQAWRPDPACLKAGDDALSLAIRCFAASGLCNRQIDHRVRTSVSSDTADEPELERFSAAWTVARHAAWVGLRPRRIANLLGYLSVWLPGSPDDPDEIASLVRAAVAEVAS
jgi:hypothetical protein